MDFNNCLLALMGVYHQFPWSASPQTVERLQSELGCLLKGSVKIGEIECFSFQSL